MGCCGSTKNSDGNYEPSCFTLCLATSNKSDYAKQPHATTYQGNKPVLVVCTDEGLMPMANGKVFVRSLHCTALHCTAHTHSSPQTFHTPHP